MANTVIQLKFSTVTSTPSTLNVAEPAYSYVSNTFFIGSPDGNGVIAIGGKFYLDQQQNIYNLSNSAFDHANAAFSFANTISGGSAIDSVARQSANSAGAYANAAFDHANAAFAAANNVTPQVQPAFNTANAAFVHANAAFSTANSAASAASSAQGTADAALTAAGVAQNSADAAFSAANGAIAVNLTQNNSITAAFAAANTADSKAESAGSYANSAFATANNEAGVNATQNTNISAAQASADAAFIRANNSLNANTGGQITGDVSITGNLSVLGNTFTVSATTIVANDTVIILGANNYTSDLLDIGFAGHYNDGVNAHAGIIRDSSNKQFYVFEGYTPEIGANNNIDPADASFRLATLNANVNSQKISANGFYGRADATTLSLYPNETYATSGDQYIIVDPTAPNHIHVRAGGLIDNSTAELFLGGENTGIQVSDTADTTYVRANGITSTFNPDGTLTVFGSITAAGVNLNSLVNSAFIAANSAGVYANGAFDAANSASVYANGAFAAANTADNKATSAGIYANGAFDAANTSQTHANYAFNHANAAYNAANTDFTNVSVTASDYGTASSVPAFRVEANGRISSANSTSIAIGASQITSGEISVARGGTGNSSLTLNGVLIGQGVSPVTTVASSTEGHILTINNSGVPTFVYLSGGTF